MRWVNLAVICFSLIYSAVSADSSAEPSLKIQARSSVYNVGEKKGIYCVGANVPDQIDWINPEGKVVEGRSTKNTRVYVERKTNVEPMWAALIIHSTKIRDTGNWTCRAGDLSDTIEIVVGEKVVMPTESEEMVSDEGKNLKLTCEAKGSPAPVVQWYKEGKQIEEDPSKYVFKKKEDVHTLEIKRLNHADAGEYMCKVTQKALSHYTHKIIKLGVHHKPVHIDPRTKTLVILPGAQKYRTEEVFAIFNETKNITCSALANPPPTFTWRKDDQIIRDPEGDTIFTSEDSMSSTLVLRMNDEKDEGQYKCTASNDKGSIVTIFHVSPGQKPIPPENINLVTGGANTTHLTFNVTCGNCSFDQEKSETLDPENLPVIGYLFELTPHNEGFPADWSQAYKFEVEIEDPEVTTFDVGPLPNNTLFHIRVSTINAAGFSDWLEMADLAQTTDHAIRLVATVFLVLFALAITMNYYEYVRK